LRAATFRSEVAGVGPTPSARRRRNQRSIAAFLSVSRG
jgi:hypothetical protein